jgi:hypothetical protein
MKIRAHDSRHELTIALRDRREEIVRSVAARVQSIEPPKRDADPDYLDGLRLAVEAAIDHTIEASEFGEDGSPAIPESILAQARRAARAKVPLETMLRRYLAGHAILGDFVIEEASRAATSPTTLRRVLRDQAARTDRTVAAISAA